MIYRERERDPEAFRCPGCETPTRGGRFCQACKDERDKDVCPECGGTPRTDHRLWCSGRRRPPE